MSDAAPAFLSGPSEMAGRMRAFDWASHPLGHPHSWPVALCSIIDLMLDSKFPMFVAWGSELTFFYNDSYLDVLGAKHPQALGAPFRDIWTEIWSDISPLIDSALSGESSYQENLPLVMNRNGFDEQTWFTFSYSPARDESGAVAGMYCVCTETTRQVMTEEALRRSDSQLRLALKAGRFGAWSLDLASGEFTTSETCRMNFGRDPAADFSYAELRESVHPDDQKRMAAAVDHSLATGSYYDIEYRVVTPGGETRWVYIRAQPVRAEDGTPLNMNGVSLDITDRKHAEQALRESEERFRLIADSAPVPMWVTKLDRTRSFVNRAYTEFLGLSETEAATFDWRTIIHPDDHDRIVAESIAGEASLKPFTLLARYHRGDGTWRWIESASQPRWGPGGEHEGFIGVAHDVTEAKEAERTLRGSNESLEKRVDERTSDLVAALDRLQAEVGERLRAEEALRQAQKMEAVGQLTGGIAHDFNNLLTPIMGGLSIIARSLDDPRLKRMAEAGLEAARRGAKLSGQLLAFSRIQRISMAPVDVNAVITAMHDLLQQTLEQRIEVTTRLDPAVGHGLCDANQLENAILNLAINARDAMPDGGTLTISTDRASLAGEPDVDDGDYVRIVVADTGAGMEPDVLRRATEPFFSTKPVGKGTGLGLAQVYGIANQSGGTLRIESAAGEGTTISILLPWTGEPAVIPSEEAASSSRRASAARLLVVDDDPDVRLFLSEALSGLGYRVTTASSGAAALATIATAAPDLVLIDFAMPGMSGADAARALREHRPGLPIVFVTGFAETQQLEAALGAEAPILRKPFGIAALAAVVESNLPVDA